ncbi:polyisoprenoid-binding protein [Alloacidobacterium dinghuense]|uniref:Polyisoprenoid-binding protein n=1 Tax=Alloacidobacterium dinghuense TaxID=2763107 RepID=A0A7G8BGH1_9BACT|nr:YceI family protein [Alloacidobacterium dinghuense]QNI31641.1 polyisoprenoid-binding protein [Alloacidobacterium dinghuense]
MKNVLRLLPVVVAILAIQAFGQTNSWKIDPVHTQATFQARHLSVTTIRGSISNVTGMVEWIPNDPSRDSVVATLDAKTVNTANDYRDKTIKGADFFNISKYPRITFRSTAVKKSDSGYQVFGDLTIAGVTRPVVLETENPAAPQKGMEGDIVTGLSATTTIKRSDFNFGAKYPNSVVSDEIKITIDLELSQK